MDINHIQHRAVMSQAATKGDSRVLALGDHDATMMDIGERSRPPGEPPDAAGSWVRRVTGGSGGGRPVPEDVLDDDFVVERVAVEFPNGEDGEPVITIGEEVLEAMNGLWKRCMIVKVLGRNVTLPFLSRKLREMWRPLGAMFVMDLPRHFFMIRFEKEDEYLAALTGGPWRMFGSYLMVQAWSPGFDPLKDEIVTTPVWIRLSNIPVNFYHKSILMGIAKGLGKPIKVDITTLNFERARFARICVEVNLKKPLKGTVVINGERYFVSYEGLANICSRCGLYGHMVHNCSKTSTEQAMPTPISPLPMGANVSEGTHTDDGFTPVTRGTRRLETRSDRNRGVVGGGRGKSNHREAMTRDEDTNVLVSNRFGNLVPDLVDMEIREEGVTQDDNKENENESILNQRSEGRSGEQERGVVFGASMVSEPGKGHRGSREKTRGISKTLATIGPKPKQLKSLRPTRGLIFGPTREELELSVSGKRMRVEPDSIGRSGGCFTNETENRRVEIGLVESEVEMLRSVSIGVDDTRLEKVDIQSNPSVREEAGLSLEEGMP